MIMIKTGLTRWLNCDVSQIKLWTNKWLNHVNHSD